MRWVAKTYEGWVGKTMYSVHELDAGVWLARYATVGSAGELGRRGTEGEAIALCEAHATLVKK